METTLDRYSRQQDLVCAKHNKEINTHNTPFSWRKIPIHRGVFTLTRHGGGENGDRHLACFVGCSRCGSEPVPMFCRLSAPRERRPHPDPLPNGEATDVSSVAVDQTLADRILHQRDGRRHQQQGPCD